MEGCLYLCSDLQGDSWRNECQTVEDSKTSSRTRVESEEVAYKLHLMEQQSKIEHNREVRLVNAAVQCSNALYTNYQAFQSVEDIFYYFRRPCKRYIDELIKRAKQEI